MDKIDASGLSCPVPVVMAKKALKEISYGQSVVVVVDNKTSAENLEKLAKSLKCGFELVHSEDNRYEAIITKSPEFDGGVLNLAETIAVISSDKMGEGDPVLGKSLMKAFIYALTEADEIPTKIIFYNGGVTLNVNGSAVEEDIKTLEKKGAAVYTCGACLNHYGLTEKLAAGEVTNMYSILEMMSKSSRIIKP